MFDRNQFPSDDDDSDFEVPLEKSMQITRTPLPNKKEEPDDSLARSDTVITVVSLFLLFSQKNKIFDILSR